VQTQEFLDAVARFAEVRAIKLYRLKVERPPAVPTLPCLDHEAMLHEGIDPHAAAYIEDQGGDLHEIVFIPDKKRIDVDSVSTMFERSDESHERLVSTLSSAFPGFRIRVVGPSRLRGDLRVAKACRAQVALRDVLTGRDLEQTKRQIDRLQTISSLMEKESRVASWGARTIMPPLLAVLGFVMYQVLGLFAPRLGEPSVSLLQYTVVGIVGGVLVYYGLKAVQLTEMANRVWKRSAEYGLILSERKRLM
jgi:hypothetical protein